MTTIEADAQNTAGRRFLIASGVGSFQEPGIKTLPGVEADVRRVRELLEPMGYQSVLTSLAHDPTRDALAEGIEDWALETSLGPDDVVVVYFAGHGVCEEDRHYLLCADTRPGRWTRALAAEDLARRLVMSEVGHLLVMLDTCYAGAGAADISRMALGLADLHRGRANRWHLASARARDRAGENAFVDALHDVFTHRRHGATQRFLTVREVTERVNAHFKTHRPTQQARLTTSETDGQDPFFPSPLFLPGLPADGTDLASISLLRRRHAGHFGPRGRGVDHVGERGDYFTGRSRALRELTAFLASGGPDHDRKARVVTGAPGSGKSAVLGRLLTLTHPTALRPATARVASGGVPSADSLAVIALHARRATLGDLVTDLASALGLPAGAGLDEVLKALADRTIPVAVIVDSLDEAGTAGDTREGNHIARELLQPLSTLAPVRLIIGTRRPQIAALGHAIHVIDLDEPGHITRSDISDYARALLEDAKDPESRSPYRHQPHLAATIANGIADRAGSSYLVARMTARALVHGQIYVDTSRPGWRERLPSDAKEAFAAYLDRFGDDRPKVERLLRPLAYAHGAGLPWSTVWAPVAEALSGVVCSQDDLDWLHQHAGAYIIETPTPDGSVYRLFHETMAEHLRRPGREQDDHAAIARALTSLVTPDPGTGVKDWAATHPYSRHHVATHAGTGGTLTALLDDPEFLVHAHPATLLRAMDATSSAVHSNVVAHPAAAVYRASAAVHASLPSISRRDVLAVDAARYQQPSLANRLARTRPYTPRWATGNLVNPAHRTTLAGHSKWVRSVAVTDIDNRPHAITTSNDKTVRVWDLTSNTERGVFTGHNDRVGAVAVAEVDGRPHAITTGADGTVRVWDLSSGAERAVFTSHTGPVTAVAAVHIHDRPHAVTTGNDNTVRVWDLTSTTERAVLTGHTGPVLGIAVTAIDNRPHAITTSDDNTVRVWDLSSRAERAVLTGHTGPVYGVAVAHLDDRPHAITTGGDTTVRVWDLTSGTEWAVLAGHTSWVCAVAVAQIGGRPHAVTTSADQTIRIWDLTSATQSAVLTGHTGPVLGIAVAQIDNRPHAVTTSADQTIRIWDLTSATQSAVLTGHTGPVLGIAVTEIDNRPHAVTTSADQTIRIWDLTSATQSAVLTGHTGPVLGIAVTEIDNRPHAVTTSADQTIRIWDLTSATQSAVLTGHTGPVLGIAVTEIDNRPHAVTTSADETIRIWDLTSRAERSAVVADANSVFGVAVAEIGGRPFAVTTGTDQTVQVWDLKYGHTERAVLTGHSEWVNRVAVAEIDGCPHAVTTGAEQTVRAWDLDSGAERAVLTGHTGPVLGIAVTEIDNRPHAVSTSDGRTVVWDLESSRVVAELSQPLTVQAIAAQGDYLVLGMANEVVVLQRSSPAD
ncbi:caspase family protein [Streptomyces sp. NPDC005017]|uniref:caspase family protein n=1 Tax=Streptomyces sp. NPDC005017 TaxID=3364706 RepID=UPI0036772AC3